MHMLASERRSKILEQLGKYGQVSTQSLVKVFDVSEDTVRRDLKELAESGRLKKVHGGAVLTSPVPFAHSERANLNREAKSKLAAEASKLLRDKMMIFVDGGTTTLQLAQHLSHDLKATFVTHSPLMAQALANFNGLEVILLGGRLVKELMITAGPDSQLVARRYRPDICLISAHGVNRAAGATVESFEDASIKREFVENSAECIVLAGREKLGFVATHQIADLDAISYLITDAQQEELVDLECEGTTIISIARQS